jgi:hypothetical protein
MKKVLLVVLVLANVVVLLGQLWPEHAPPFAHTVNVATLAANVLVFALQLRGAAKKS